MKIKDSYRVEVEMEQSTAPEFRKISTDYYEHKLQVRFRYFESIEELREEIHNKIIKEFGDYINKFEEVSTGLDYFFRNHGCMNDLSQLFRRNYLTLEKRSNKVVGLDQLTSKNKYRYFQSIILINLRKKDLVMYKGDEYQIKALNKNDLVLLDMKTGQKKVVTYSIVEDYIKKIEN